MNAFFLRVNVTFYDAVSIIHYVITTPDPFPYTAKFMFVGVRRKKLNNIIKLSIGRNDNFENYQFSQPR